MTAGRQGSSTTATPAGRLSLLDCARLVAALMVLSFHWTFNGIVNGKIDDLPLTPITVITRYGYWGVTLFFLISGFVIAESVRGRKPSAFALSRLNRLYPAFWAAVLLTGTVELIVRAEGMRTTPLTMLVNLTMFPSWLGADYVDGVYWTLEYELIFYGLVLVSMLALRGRDITPVFVVWLAVIVLLEVLMGEEAPIGLGRPFAAFASGALIASARHHGWRWWIVGSVAIGWVATVVPELRHAADLQAYSGERISGLVVVAMIAAFYALLIAQTFPRVGRLRIPGSRAMGDLTYPLYLVHAHLGYMALSALATPDNAFFVYPSLLLAILLLAWAIHRYVEVAMRPIWRRLFGSFVGLFAKGPLGRTTLTPITSKGVSPHE